MHSACRAGSLRCPSLSHASKPYLPRAVSAAPGSVRMRFPVSSTLSRNCAAEAKSKDVADPMEALVSETVSSPQDQAKPKPRHMRLPFDMGELSGTTVMAAGGAGLFAIQSVAVLAVIVAVHEYGHFQAARSQGIHVSKFSVGFGPAVWSTMGSDGIEYSYRLFPLGGYVAFPGDEKPMRENPEWTAEQKEAIAKAEADKTKYHPDDPNLLKNRSMRDRGIVISAGVAANIVFAYATLLLQVSTVGKAESMLLPGVSVPEVVATSAAARGGLHSGDLIVGVEDYYTIGEVGSQEQLTNVVSAIKSHPNSALRFRVERDGSIVDLSVTPDMDAKSLEGRIGARLGNNVHVDHTHPSTTGETFELANSEFIRLSGTVANGLGKLVSDFSSAAAHLSSPIAIVATGSDVLRTDTAGIFQFCAIININLAAVNLLPIPGLDGGYLAFLLLEAVRGRKVPEGVEGTVMTSGLMLLLGSGMFLAFRDMIKILL
eukprot:gene1209-32551_t